MAHFGHSLESTLINIMKAILKKIFLLIILITSVVILYGGDVQAQQNTCDVNVVSFRTNRDQESPSFYEGDNRPYVYIDFLTSGCVGQTIEVSITEDDTLTFDDDLNGVIGTNDPCNNQSSTCMDNRLIGVPADNFTVSLKAGEEECEFEGDPDCHYHLETTDTVNGLQVWDAIDIEYDCDGNCQDLWEYLGPLTIFQGNEPADPDLPLDDTQNGDEGTEINITDNGGNSSNPDEVLNLSLQNPLAGTIDTIPQLFQKIVEIIIKIGIPLVAMAIVYSGLLFVTARGSDEQLKKAKNAFTFAIIGGLILLTSWLVAEAIRDALTSFN